MIKAGLKLVDNSSEEYQLGTVIKELLTNDSFSQISIASGYWDLPGMVYIFDELHTFLNRDTTNLRLLLGEEPYVKAYQIKNPARQDPEFPEKYLKRDLEDLNLKHEFQKIVALLIKHLNEKSKFEVRIYRKNFLHAKCYIFGSAEENAIGILGSSNFTRQGLIGNLELNQIEDNNATVNFIRKNLDQHPSHRVWFEELWNNSEPWSGVFREEILELSKHGNICYSPYEMYIHALYRIYGQELQDEKEEKVENNDPGSGIPQLLKFQIQNANSLIKKLERQSVAMLSDSVGLGKTYTAIKVIEYYMFYPEKNQRVVVICPAGLKSQWEKAFAGFQFKHMPEILSLQDIVKVEDRRENYKSIPVGLFVFDESHNLRTSGGNRFDVFIKWRQENENAKTLLLTATPINNQLSDLTNQIMLGSGGNIYKLGRFYDRSRQKYFTLKERFELLQADIRRQIRETGAVDYSQIKEQLTPLLNRFIVRRTRQGIEKEYPNGLQINGSLQKFPKSIPDNIEYDVQNQFKSQLLAIAAKYPPIEDALKYSVNSFTELEYLSHPLDLKTYYTIRETPVNSSLEIVYTAILALGFPCYRYNIYRHAYYGRRRGELQLNADENRELSRQIGIYGIFRTVFLKRLESSLFSISRSIDSYHNKLTDFREKLKKFNKIISVKNLAQLNKVIDAYNEEYADEDQLDFDILSFEEMEEGFIAIPADEGVFNLEQLKDDIEKDFQILKVLKEQINLLIKKDDKIQKLANHLNQNEENKVLIFTYFADTLNYLKENLPKYLIHNRNIEFAAGSKTDIENFACRFAPVSKKYELKQHEKEIQYLVATDKLSEGQNLQDSGIIINYDLHWNPVRMIQRNGRVNRLGSTFDEIFIYNFRPTEQLESYLQLVRKLQDKINLIRYTIGSDQSVLDEEPIPQDFTEDLYSRDEKKRMEAFQKIFETSEFLAAEDLFMDDLREFDRNPHFSDAYKLKIKNLPKGKWGRIQMLKEEDEILHLTHLSDNNGEAGYFVAFSKDKKGELITTSEGLLHIKATSEQNERFKDKFMRKPETEDYIYEFIKQYQFAEDDHVNRYNDPQTAAINFLVSKMQEYGYPVNEIEKLYSCLIFSQNAYINKQNMKLVRLVNRLIRQNKHVGDDLIHQFINLAHQYTPDQKSEKAPLEEIIQIFV